MGVIGLMKVSLPTVSTRKPSANKAMDFILSLVNYLPEFCNYCAIPTVSYYKRSVRQERRNEIDALFVLSGGN